MPARNGASGDELRRRARYGLHASRIQALHLRERIEGNFTPLVAPVLHVCGSYLVYSKSIMTSNEA